MAMIARLILAGLLFAVAALLFSLAGCSLVVATSDDLQRLPRAPYIDDGPDVYFETGPSWTWGIGSGVSSGGTHSVRGWQSRGDGLEYKVRKYPTGRR